jgi:hypothetical protein
MFVVDFIICLRMALIIPRPILLKQASLHDMCVACSGISAELLLTKQCLSSHGASKCLSLSLSLSLSLYLTCHITAHDQLTNYPLLTQHVGA